MSQNDCAPFIKLAKKAIVSYLKKKGGLGNGGGNGVGGTGTRDAGVLGELTAVAGALGASKWKLSNIGGIGSDEDAALRKQAAEGEPEFENAGRTPGIEVWRIEKFNPAKQAIRAKNLQLYSGDAYIVLVTTQNEDSVNIDDMLGGKPVQYREVQGEESDLFLSYFTSLTYLDGGIDSGFKTVTPLEYNPRLLLVKSSRSTVQVSQISLDGSHINHGDVFILDNGLQLYQFNGSSSSVSERRRAMEIVEEDIQGERNGQPELTILDGDEALECDAFWDLLKGSRPSKIPEGVPVSSLDAGLHNEVDFSADKKLFCISDESGELTLTLVKEESSLSASDVNEDDVWCVSCSDHLFIYVGSRTSKDERFYVTQSVDKILEAAELSFHDGVTIFSPQADMGSWERLFS